MNEGRFPGGGIFHFLLSSWTLPPLAGNSLLVITKSKASEYEQLVLASTRGKSLRRFRKDNHLEKFDTC